MNTNYCADLLDSLQLSGQHANLAEQIKQSIKFRLPDDGMVLDINSTGKSIKQRYEPYIPIIKLPYPLVAMEYDLTASDGTRQPMVLVAMQGDNNIAVKCIFYHSGLKKWGVFGGTGRMIGQWGDFTLGADADGCPDPNDSDFRDNMKYAFNVILTLMAALACSNSSIIDDVSPSKVKQDMRKRKGKYPLFSYKVLTIDTQNTNSGAASGIGTHNSPRIHLRRGHIRRLPNKTVWINACLVGDKSKGMVTKDYRVI